MSGTITWARLWPAAKTSELSDSCLRLGAWYPVRSREPGGKIVLGLTASQVSAPAYMFQLTRDMPSTFTVVRRRPQDPNPAFGTPENLGCTYAVCPSCMSRVRLYGRPDYLACSACQHAGTVDWTLAG